MAKKKTVKKKGNLILGKPPEFSAVDEVKYFMHHMLEHGQSIHVNVLDQQSRKGFQIGNMSATEILGALAIAEAQIKNGIIQGHNLDAMVQLMENRPDLVKRYTEAMHKAHTEANNET